MKLNQASIEITGVLSNELDLDELNTAELLYNASDLSYKKERPLAIVLDWLII